MFSLVQGLMLSFLYLYSRRVWTIFLLEECWSTGFTHTTTGHICKVKKPWLYQDYPGLEAIQHCPGYDFENQSYLGVSCLVWQNGSYSAHACWGSECETAAPPLSQEGTHRQTSCTEPWVSRVIIIIFIAGQTEPVDETVLMKYSRNYDVSYQIIIQS